MTPEQRVQLRDAWIAELWRPVPQWHATKDEKADAQERNAALDETRGEPELPWRVA